MLLHCSSSVSSRSLARKYNLLPTDVVKCCFLYLYNVYSNSIDVYDGEDGVESQLVNITPLESTSIDIPMSDLNNLGAGLCLFVSLALPK